MSGTTAATRPRTLLQALVQQRHPTREQVIDVLERRAAEMRVPDFALSLRQLDRWFAGAVSTLPRPSICRVIEAEFGYPAQVLLGPESDLPLAGSRHLSSHVDRKLRTAECVAWIANQSNVAFDNVYAAVAELADRMNDQPHAQRAAKKHTRAGISRDRKADAVQGYYASPAQVHFYGATVDTRTVRLSVLTRAEWVGLGVALDGSHDCFRLSGNDEPDPINLTPTALSAAIGRLASVEVSDTVLIDNPLYRLLDTISAVQRSPRLWALPASPPTR